MRATYPVLMAVILFAFAMRLYPVQASLPYTYWHDENNYVEDALRMAGGNLKPFSYSHGGLYQLVLGIIYGLYFILLKVLGAVTSPASFLVGYLRDPSVFFILGRVISILCGTSLIYLSYAITAKIFNARAALIAAIFTGFSLLTFQMSIFALADVPATFLLACAFLCVVLSIQKTGDRSLYYAASLLVGLAVAGKLHCVFGVAFLFVAAFIKYRDERLRSVVALVRMLAAGSAMVMAGFFIGVPSALFNIGAVYQDTVVRIGGAHITVNPNKHRWLYYFTNHMRNGWGVPLEILSLCGMGYALYRRTRWDLLLVVFPISQYLIFMNITGFAYHIIPLSFFVFILAGRFLDELLSGILFRRSIFFATLAAALIVFPSFIDSIKLIKVVASPDTRTIAKSWIEDNIEKESTVLEEGCLFGNAISSPQLAGNVESVKRDFDGAVAIGGSGSLQKVKMAYYDELYAGSSLYDVVKVDKLKESDILSNDPLFIITTSNNDDTFVSYEMRYFIEEGYYESRNAMKKTLAKRYALERSFAPTVEFTSFFPHFMDRDYHALRSISLAGSKSVIRGPRIDIYRRKL